jgi:hypothetical protein
LSSAEPFRKSESRTNSCEAYLSPDFWGKVFALPSRRKGLAKQRQEEVFSAGKNFFVAE